MRVIKHYMFNIKTKIPFSEWPAIVHCFLSETNLTSHRFLYFFSDFLWSDEINDTSLAYSGCGKLLKDCPSLGTIRYHNKIHRNDPIKIWLSNIDQTDDFSESNLLPLMKKIHRRYGICENVLYYFDIDFFGKRTFFERDYSTALRMSNPDKAPFDPTLCIEYQPYGSGITLHRDINADNYLKLSVDLVHDGIVMDATPYYEAMQKLLPQIKATSSLSIYLSEEEKLRFEEINHSAEPILQKCRSFLSDRLPHTASHNSFPSNYSLAQPLKKLAKKYGYTYKLEWNGGTYSLEKRTAKGNVIYIAVDSGPSHFISELCVTYQGVGFHHRIGWSSHTPTNQQEVDAFVEDVLSVMSEFENTLLPTLDSFFPETPSWFIPSLFL